MVNYKNIILVVLTVIFLVFSFYPTIYEIRNSKKVSLKNRDFILEHNYYWPDFNLYLSKIRQGYEGRWVAVEKYTNEPHRGSLVQIFYLYLGKIGAIFQIDPNYAYQLGRIIHSPLLLIVILALISFYFKFGSFQILAFLITITSGSFPRLYYENGQLMLGRYMEWWSNTDSLQRITFIPHILLGQIISFYLLYELAIKKRPIHALQRLNIIKLFFYIILANIAGFVFPPSLMTLLGVIFSLFVIKTVKNKFRVSRRFLLETASFIILSLPSLIYLFIITKYIPWSALVEFHRTHPMMVALDQYVLGTGPIIILGFFGSILAILRRQSRYYPLILWVAITFLFAALFSLVKEQSPLRFTQTGLFIPLGILGAYFLFNFRRLGYLFIFLFILENLVIMTNSLNWQLTFMKQRISADVPPVPFPPQTMYPLTDWMKGIYWLRDNTRKDDIILAEFTAGNFIPAYAGNFVYFGQSNTVDYERKQVEVDRFFNGKMSPQQAEPFLKNNRIKYIFVGPQEKEKLASKKLEVIYPFINPKFTNSVVSIYSLK